MATQSYQLVMRAGPTIGKTFAISKAEMSIGRDISNDIVINDAEVSRKHVRLVLEAGEIVLEDMGSTNGTFINDQRISGPHTLVVGDTVQLGEHVILVFEATRQDADATMAVGPGEVFSHEPEPAYSPMPVAPPQPQYQPPAASTATEMPLPPTGPLHASTPEAPPKDNRRTIIIAVAAFVVLCCVCPAISYALYYAYTLFSAGL